MENIHNVTIVSRNFGIFSDRMEAGRFLADELKFYKDSQAVVLGIPRGGVVIAAEIARGLLLPLDMIFSRKIGAPGHPEYAIGAMSEDGEVYLNDEAIAQWQIGQDYIIGRQNRQRLEIQRLSSLFRQFYPKVPVENRIVILTDDGVATGATMQAALWSLIHEHPHRTVVALPVGTEQALTELAKDADEVICLNVPESFSGVGQFYQNFAQVSDEDVASILRSASRKGKQA